MTSTVEVLVREEIGGRADLNPEIVMDTVRAAIDGDSGLKALLTLPGEGGQTGTVLSWAVCEENVPQFRALIRTVIEKDSVTGLGR